MLVKKIMKGTFKGAFLLIFSILLVGCANSDESDEPSKEEKNIELIELKSTNEVVASDIKFDPETHEISSPDFTIKLLTIEKKQDIDDKKSCFIYADITNSSTEVLYPENVWNTYLRFSEDEEGNGGLYQNVLPKDDLDGSEYKSAIDNMSKELKPSETLRIGSFYGMPEGGSIYLSLLNDEMEVFYSGKMKIK